MANQRLSFTDLNLILQFKHVIRSIKKKLSGLHFSKITLFDLWLGRSILHKKDVRNQGETSTSISDKNLFKFCATSIYYRNQNVNLMLQKSLATIKTPKHPSQNTCFNTRSERMWWKFMNHQIMYGPRNAHRTSYSQDWN